MSGVIVAGFLPRAAECDSQAARAEVTHVESAPVAETFRADTMWDGVVEVFSLRGHPHASKSMHVPTILAWGHKDPP